MYYRSIIPLIDSGTSGIGLLATVLMLIITADFYYLWYITKDYDFSKFNDDNKRLAHGLFLVTIFHFLFYIMEGSFAINFRLTDLCLAVFILISMSPLRVNTLRLFRIVYASREIILLFMINWLFFSAVARIIFQMFDKYYDNEFYYIYNFTTFTDTFFTLYVLMTTGNYPDAMVKKVYPHRWVFLFYLIYTFITIFIMCNMLTGVLYFNYTGVVTKSIEENKDNEEFKLIMKLCLKDGVVTKERVREILHLYSENPEILKYKAALVNCKKGKMQEMLKYSKLDATKNSHFTDKVWWRVIFACIDAAIVVLCIIVIEYNFFGQILWQAIVMALAVASAIDWVLRIFKSGKSYAIDEAKKATNVIGILSSLLIIIAATILIVDYSSLDPASMLPTGTNAPKSPVDWNLVRFWGFSCLFKFQKPIAFVARLPQVGLTLTITYHLVPF